MAKIGCSENYSHSPVHNAVSSGEYDELRRLLQSLNPRRPPSEILTESDAIAEEEKAEEISGVIDRRDVPNRETPLHLAVKLGDVAAAEMLMLAGANWTLQNEQGWNALQEAICNRQESIATVIYQHSKPLAWAKWCRRLPRLIGAMRKMRDFYMEMTFHFESSVIPFISRIAPSDTYRIWKRGSNLRADMTLAGFDGFKIQRSDQSVLFLGEGSGEEDEEDLKPGSLCVVLHKDKEVINAWDGAGSEVKESEARRQVDAMLRTKVTKPGIDVSQAILVPQLTWRRHERREMVGQWKAKVYDVHNVVFKVRSRQVSEENSNSSSNDQLMSSTEIENEAYKELLTEDELKQLETVLEMDSMESEGNVSINNVDGVIQQRRHHGRVDQREITAAPNVKYSCSDGEVKREKKGWFRSSNHRDVKHHGKKKKKMPRLRSSPCLNESVSNIEDLNSGFRIQEDDGCSLEIDVGGDDDEIRGMDLKDSSSSVTLESGIQRKDSNNESEYKKGLRPVLWLSHDFPLQVEELFPLLDILANKVKAIRRLRELLATKLPPRTFPVKVAIPVVPTVQVLVTFTKFEELQQLDEFSTPPSSPSSEEANITSTQSSRTSSSWRQWIKAPYTRNSSLADAYPIDAVEGNSDPFALPPGYTWTTFEARSKKKKRYSKPRKARSQGK